MKQLIRKWMGISDLLEESALWNKELSKFGGRLDTFQREFNDIRKSNHETLQEARNLFQRMSQKFDNVTPASPEFFDEMRRQMEARMDQTMNACDRMADEMKLARR